MFDKMNEGCICVQVAPMYINLLVAHLDYELVKPSDRMECLGLDR